MQIFCSILWLETKIFSIHNQTQFQVNLFSIIRQLWVIILFSKKDICRIYPMLLRIKTESLYEDCVCFCHWHLMNILQVPFHAAKVWELFVTQCTGLFCVVSSPPLLVNFSHMSFHLLFRLKCFATCLTVGGLLTMRFHVTIQMVRIGVALSTLVAYVNLVTWVMRSFLVVIKCFCVFEHEFANITLDVLVFGIMRRKMEV